MPNVLIAGGTGLVGNALQRELEANGFSVSLLSRKTTGTHQGMYRWNAAKQIADASPFQHADFIVNLAGANIGEKRLTKNRKRAILNSRLDATRLIEKMLRANRNVKAVVQASAFGYYGDGHGKLLSENAPPGSDFLANVCVQWEAAANEIREDVSRVAVFRFAHVLSANGGLLPRLMQPMKFGMMPIFGGGQQHIPWIHEDDLARMILFALQHENVNGAYNAVSPRHATLSELLQAAADAMKRKPIKLHLPKPLIKLGVGELGESFYYDVMLDSEKIQGTGFQFRHADLSAAIKSLISS